MRLKHGAFRHLRMAAKGAALGTRRLLKKVDENFTLKKADESFVLRVRSPGENAPWRPSQLRS